MFPQHTKMTEDVFWLLTHATGVWFNPATTVKQVDDEVKALDLAFQATLDRGPADGKLRTN
jgi:cAMP factor